MTENLRNQQAVNNSEGPTQAEVKVNECRTEDQSDVVMEPTKQPEPSTDNANVKDDTQNSGSEINSSTSCVEENDASQLPQKDQKSIKRKADDLTDETQDVPNEDAPCAKKVKVDEQATTPATDPKDAKAGTPNAESTESVSVEE